MKDESSNSFKALAGLFVSFKDETQLNPMQLAQMKEAMRILNSFDPKGKLNSEQKYAIAYQLDESESNPFYEVDLPEVPENPMPSKAETKPSPSKRMAQIDLENYNIDVMPESINFLASDEIVLGGSLNFKENVPLSKKLEWCERKLLS